MKFIFEIKTDDDFNILYCSQPTRYCDNFQILFNFHDEKYNFEEVLKVLKNVKLIPKPHKDGYCVDAERLFKLLKRGIKNNPTMNCGDILLGGNYTFHFYQTDDVDIVIDIGKKKVE